MRADRSFGSARGLVRAWLPWVAAAALIVVYVPFFETLAMVSAQHPYAGHVIFVPIFAAGLLWLERRQFRDSSDQGHASGMAVTALAVAVAGLGYATADLTLQALSLVVATAGMALWFHGVRGIRQAGFVLAFLLLMVPPPRDVVSAVAPAIQHVVAAFSAQILEGLRIPVAHQGIFLRLPQLTLEVAEECAGLRFSLILFVFVSAFARAVVPTFAGQMILIALSFPVAMLANATRVAVTSVGAYVIGAHVATGPLHYYIGKTFWLLALVAMIGLTGLLRARENGRSRAARCVVTVP
jgi:exosortase